MKTEIVWAAGFWDGEGSCWLSAGRPILSIGQTDTEVLERFRDAVGLGTVRGPYLRNHAVLERRDGYRRRPILKWQVSGEGARVVAAMLRPLVSGQKREQFDRVLGDVEEQLTLWKGAS